MHAEFLRGLALIALVACQNLKNVPPLKLANSVRVVDTGVLHLGYQTIQFAFQETPDLRSNGDRSICSMQLRLIGVFPVQGMRLQRIWGLMQKMRRPVRDLLLKMLGHNEG